MQIRCCRVSKLKLAGNFHYPSLNQSHICFLIWLPNRVCILFFFCSILSPLSVTQSFENNYLHSTSRRYWDKLNRRPIRYLSFNFEMNNVWFFAWIYIFSFDFQFLTPFYSNPTEPKVTSMFLIFLISI